MRSKESRLGDVLEAVPLDDERYRTYAYLDTKAKRDRANGNNFAQKILTPEADSVGTIGRGYSKARSTEPLLVHPTNPNLKRLLTPVEHARVKTVPEHLVKRLSNTVAHEVLGQSVVHSAFVAVGLLVGNALHYAYSQAVARGETENKEDVFEAVMEFGEPPVKPTRRKRKKR